MPSEAERSVAQLLGQNCRRLRTSIGATQDELARHARDIGLRWTASKVGDFESGRSAPAFATVVAVALALQKAQEAAGGRSGRSAPVFLPDLVHGAVDQFVSLTDSLDISAQLLDDLCRGDISGNYRQVRPRLKSVPTSALDALLSGGAAAILERSGVAESRLAHRLNISKQLLAALSFSLWQKTFSEERDRRAGDAANRQHRGQVTRALQAEIERRLADGDD